MRRVLATWNASEPEKPAPQAASHAAVHSRRYAASSLTTPSHLRFEKVVRERGRRRAGSGCPGWRNQQKKCKAGHANEDVRRQWMIDLQVAELAVSGRVGGCK